MRTRGQRPVLPSSRISVSRVARAVRGRLVRRGSGIPSHQELDREATGVGLDLGVRDVRETGEVGEADDHRHRGLHEELGAAQLPGLGARGVGPLQDEPLGVDGTGMMFAEGGVEVLDELSREPHGKLFLSGAHRVSGGSHRRSFRMPNQPVRTNNTVTTTEGRGQADPPVIAARWPPPASSGETRGAYGKTSTPRRWPTRARPSRRLR